jgi:predicted amidohydrolase
MRVATWQAPADQEADRGYGAALAAAVGAAAAAGAELLVLPELALLGPPGAAGLEPLATASDGAPARRLGALARASGIAIATGYLEACSGRLHSAALLVDGRGHALANYRRSHLRAAEEARLARGAWLSVMPLGGRRLGLLIGYDLRFPEVARALVLAGADLLVVLGPWPVEPEAALGPLAAARAIENGVPLALACWAAAGGAASRILGPDGAPLARAGTGPDLVLADLPAALGAAAGLADRRPRLYQQLVADAP